jgi:hypothetical protein
MTRNRKTDILVEVDTGWNVLYSVDYIGGNLTLEGAMQVDGFFPLSKLQKCGPTGQTLLPGLTR